MYKKKTHIHFIGIGGIGMSGIAKILKNQGYFISGCDTDLSQKSVRDLLTAGCTVYEGNNTTGCHDTSIDIVVYSSAILSDNPELIAARARNVPTIPRALMLAELMRTKYSIAIAGSHGKTTTTSLISHILFEAHYDPTVIIGGHLKSISTNAHSGKGDFLVAEADESDRSLTKLHPTLAVLTNIDREHLDVYKDLDDIKNTFLQFLNNVPFYGKAVLCLEDSHIKSMLPLNYPKTQTYGFSSEADIYASNIQLFPDYSQFTVNTKQTCLGTITLKMPGQHNILNALAALSVSLELGVSFDIAAQALSQFNGVDRRFTFRGTYKDAEIFDDYGHHPEEIKQTLMTARKRAKGRLIVLFQPHRYSRTYHLWNDFIRVFGDTISKHNKIDSLIITDIYPASEKPIANITSERLVKEIQEYSQQKNVCYIPLDKELLGIKEKIENIINKDDLVLLLGAGNAYLLTEQLKKTKNFIEHI